MGHYRTIWGSSSHFSSCLKSHRSSVFNTAFNFSTSPVFRDGFFDRIFLVKNSGFGAVWFILISQVWWCSDIRHFQWKSSIMFRSSSFLTVDVLLSLCRISKILSREPIKNEITWRFILPRGITRLILVNTVVFIGWNWIVSSSNDFLFKSF